MNASDARLKIERETVATSQNENNCETKSILSCWLCCQLLFAAVAVAVANVGFFAMHWQNVVPSYRHVLSLRLCLSGSRRNIFFVFFSVFANSKTTVFGSRVHYILRSMSRIYTHRVFVYTQYSSAWWMVRRGFARGLIRNILNVLFRRFWCGARCFFVVANDSQSLSRWYSVWQTGLCQQHIAWNVYSVWIM